MALDADEFERLYREFYPRVTAFVTRRVPPGDGADLVNEAFLTAWRRRDRITAESMLPWLFTTIMKINANRRRCRVTEDAVLAEVTRLSRLVTTGSPETDVIERLAVYTALSRLSEQDREALVLTGWDGLDIGTAARVLRCSATAFAVRLHRARRRFTAALAEYERHARDGHPMMAGERTI